MAQDVNYAYNNRLIGSSMWSIEWCHFQWPWMTLTQVSRARNYSTFNISETIQDRPTRCLQTTRKCYVAYWIVQSSLTLIDLQGDFSNFCLKISVSDFSVSDTNSRRSSDIANDLEWHLKFISRFHCPYLKISLSLMYLRTLGGLMYEVDYNGWTWYVSNYFYCRIRPEGLLYDAVCALLAIAKFVVR